MREHLSTVAGSIRAPRIRVGQNKLDRQQQRRTSLRANQGFTPCAREETARRGYRPVPHHAEPAIPSTLPGPGTRPS